jgi:peptidoglycan/LPS O-acetylase OafA/YrhL
LGPGLIIRQGGKMAFQGFYTLGGGSFCARSSSRYVTPQASGRRLEKERLGISQAEISEATPYTSAEGTRNDALKNESARCNGKQAIPEYTLAFRVKLSINRETISRLLSTVINRWKNKMVASEQRILELNGLRGIAVAMVLVWHFVGAIISPDLGVLSKIASNVFVFGRTGVDLFFVLSGFLIIGILTDRRDSRVYFLPFYLRRAARILPPYLLLVALFWIFTLLLPPSVYFGKTIQPLVYLVFGQNWFMSFHNEWGPSASSVTWSVAIEWQFYLIFPLIVFFTPPTRLKVVLIWLAVGSVVARACFHFFYPENNFTPYVNTFLRLDGLCVGGLAALAYRNPDTLAQLQKNQRNIGRAFFIGVATIPFFVAFFRRAPADTMYYWGHSYLVIFYAIGLLNILLNQGSPSLAVLRSKALQFYGKISYSVYLFHPMVIGLFFLSRGRVEKLETMEDVFLLVAAFATTIAFCWTSYHLLEKPMISWGHRVRYS